MSVDTEALRDLPAWMRAFIAVYPWRRVDPVPRASLTRPLRAARVALVSSAGLVAPGQAAFDEHVRGGDASFRVLARDVPLSALECSHRSEAWDARGVEADRNLAFPRDRLLELAEGGHLGDVAPRHLSFMGSITAPGRLVRQSAPAAVQVLLDDQVDVALLVPV